MSLFVKIPPVQELRSISGIDSLIHSIAAYVDQEGQGKDYRTVLMVYGAFCEAMIQENILNPAEIPTLRFHYQQKVYVVSKKPGLRTDVICDADFAFLKTYVSTVEKYGNDNQQMAMKKKSNQKTVESRAMDLLNDLQTWSCDLRPETRGMKRKAQEMSLGHDDCSIESVKQRLKDVAHHEKEISRMNGLANLSYYRLGRAYQAWAAKSFAGLSASITTRAFHSTVFPRFCLEFDKLRQPHDVQKAYGLRKKLERARKFRAIGEIIGPEKLPKCRGLSVLKIDAVPMRVLDVLLNEFPEQLQALQNQE